ncbi:MAG: primosomal protein N' [Deltaproteobacteria bacterium]|nr:MAG: primosomal protein N' [Deltaproteobacteria bacterium]
MSKLFVEVAVVLPVFSTYHYRVPPELSDEVAVGRSVLIPFGRRRLTGYIVSLDTQPPATVRTEIRDILQVSPDEHFLAETHLPFYRWLSSYYLAPFGEVIQSALPPGTSTVTRRAAFVGRAGDRALRESTATSEEVAVLSLVGEEPGLSLSQIRHRLPDHAVDQLCGSLGRRGLILWKDHVQVPSVRPRHLKTVSLDRTVTASAAGELKPKEKEILALLEERPRLLSDLRQLVGNGSYWVQKMASRGLVSVRTEEVYRDPVGPSVLVPGSVPKLTEHQEQAVMTIGRALRQGTFTSFLLHGVTGSGKTEVYLAAAAEAIKLQRRTLVLVPEIALTAQMEALFRQRFKSQVAVLHSGLGRGERRDEWMRVRRDEVDVVVGARSALFAPLERLGLLVVDEEHDASYKQERGLRYHGRDAAVMRAKLEGAVVLMGSATPALSSYYNALQGKFQLLVLPLRIDRRPLPEVFIVDMRRQRRTDLISHPLRQALTDTLAAGKQALLLINRRGFANFLLCRRCGHVERCLNCAVSLTWHRAKEKLLCHVCGLARKVPAACPQCSATTFRPFGFGTERIEAEVRRLFPEARVSRMDRDTTRNKQASRRLLYDLRRGRTDILVGTQMIAKGHDFPGITLVGVVSADIGLQWPDFRAAESTFQLLTQVAGRAGRGDSPGIVLVQTFNPQHFSIRFAKEHDYQGFYREEMAFREELGYPPYQRLILFQLAGNVEQKTQKAAERLTERYQELRHQRPNLFLELEALGPVAAPVPRVKGKFRWQLVLKSNKPTFLLEVARMLMHWGLTALKGSGVSLSADVDPVSLI